MQKKFLYFFGSAFAISLLFYLYPAEIFQAEIANGVLNITADVSLKCWIHQDYLPDGLLLTPNTTVSFTFQGLLILLICCFGLPAMIAMKFGTDKKEELTEDK